MAKQYYYLVSGLDNIYFNQEKEVPDPKEFFHSYQSEISTEHLDILKSFFLTFDNINLINKLTKKDMPFADNGLFSEEELESGIKYHENMPSYMIAFIQAYQSEKRLNPQLSLDDELAALFHEHIKNIKNPFLTSWFEFEQNLNNVLTGLNCRKFDLDVKKSIIGSNDAAELLRKSSAPDFGLSFQLTWFDQVRELFQDSNLKEMENGLDLIRWNYLDEILAFHYFSIENIFAYLVRLSILKRWQKLTTQAGQSQWQNLIENIENKLTFDEQFALGGRKE